MAIEIIIMYDMYSVIVEKHWSLITVYTVSREKYSLEERGKNIEFTNLMIFIYSLDIRNHF